MTCTELDFRQKCADNSSMVCMCADSNSTMTAVHEPQDDGEERREMPTRSHQFMVF